jgi:uncharacterized metal-binding protein YceD (DUF177 family)
LINGELTAMATLLRPWVVPVRIDEIPESGRTVELDADEAARAAAAKAAGVDSIARLRAEFSLSRAGPGRVHVTGTVSATVRQTCVVTLEAVTNEVNEAVDLVFAPTDAGIESAVEGINSPEPLVDETIDLGAVATEFVILGVDPYPRKPGVVFRSPATEDASASPFAALAALKKRKSKSED